MIDESRIRGDVWCQSLCDQRQPYEEDGAQRPPVSGSRGQKVETSVAGFRRVIASRANDQSIVDDEAEYPWPKPIA